MKIEDIKIGDVVYKEEHWSGEIFSAQVVKILDGDIIALKGLDFVDREGRKTSTFGGSLGCSAEHLHKTAAEAYDAKLAKYNKQIEDYKNEIQTLEDLLRFPLVHPFGAEEYRDDAAIKAYCVRCKELQGIEVRE